ncbi:uncharacterized protein LOC143212057 [Lasioglossum baleicum]|uniref:uncharacterized protein LOC143212057 n=1 Tax=Lasioglossum baleicum TaxID=434251 RepID=UPI003FCE8B62
MDKGVFNLLFLILLIQIASHGSTGKKHVHLRIHVPDIIKHHIHTKVVFLHVHKPAPKKPKTHHKEYHHENWSSWSYGNHHDHDHTHDDEENNAKHFHDHEDQSERERLAMLEPQSDHKIYGPRYNQHGDSYFPQSYVDDNHLHQNQKNREHGQYEVREEVNDTPQNEETLVYNYEEGYRKGLQSESGHIRTGQSSKFHDDQHEENDDNDNDGFKEESEGRTDAGRYIVDDVEYENTRDKRDGRRRYRRIRRL